MSGLLLKMSFWDKIGTFFDIIPKLVYFLSAVFLSAIDVLQCLVRKLAGLDVYYVEVAGAGTAVGSGRLDAVSQTDPLSEFIYGILGMGDSAPVYKGLNTVFWSLVVFAILCLSVTTMIAIIKSHYNEDTAGTSPWKYVYTAIKAVLTFAIVPFAVIIGMEFASWTLRSLDSITAGSATQEAVVSMYGQTAASHFEAGYIPGTEDDPNANKYYSHYDMFGMGNVTSSTPFSGLLFKACSYDANRARVDQEYANILADLETSNDIKIFGQNGDKSSTVVADQVDYAFMNYLRFNGDTGYWGHEVTAQTTNGNVKYWSVTDFINGLGRFTKGFSKWNVGFVWQFYNLWSYNFIVAFGGGVTIMGIMLSVIIGLMSRLMKGAVLFLIYPSLLGIAPLDNFKAFKSWTNQFIQQVMMAFGAIIGMNLTLLVLPYVQNFRFFGPGYGVVDAIVNVIVVITALLLMKDFISMISSFVGGADANNVGGGMKGEVGKAFGTGAKIAGVTGLAATAATTVGAVAVGKKVWAGGGLARRAGRRIRLNALQRSTTKHSADIKAAEGKKEEDRTAKEKRLVKRQGKFEDGVKNYQDKYGVEFVTDIKSGKLKSADGQNWWTREGKGKLKDSTIRGLKRAGGAAAVLTAPLTAPIVGGIAAFSPKFRGWIGDKLGNSAVGKGAKKAGAALSGGIFGFKKDSEGKDTTELKAPDFKSFAKMAFGAATMMTAGKLLANGFLKSVGTLSSSAGLDKVMKGMGDIFKEGLTFKGGVFDSKGKKPEGDKLSEQLHKESEAAAKERAKQASAENKELLEAIKSLKEPMVSVATKMDQMKGSFTAMSAKLDGKRKKPDVKDKKDT